MESLIYGIMSFGTVGYIFLSVVLIARFSNIRSLAFFYVVILYLWTVYGAWFVVLDASGATFGQTFNYLYDEMFSVYVDEDYAISIGIYFLFLFVAVATPIGLSFSYPKMGNLFCNRTIRMSPMLFCVFSLLFLGLACFFVFDLLKEAFVNVLSAYLLKKDFDASMYKGFQLFSILSLQLSALAIVGLFSPKPLYLIMHGGWLLKLLSVVFFSLTILLLIFLGARSIMIMGALTLLLLFFLNNKNISYFPVISCFFIALFILVFSGAVRGGGIDAYDSFSFGDIVLGVFSLTLSNEFFAAHFSMYGAVAASMDYRFGEGLLALANYFIPSFLLERGMVPTYSYYSQIISHASGGQGFTIHHATSWFLEFGVVGVVMGGLTLGGVFGACALMFSRQHLYAGILRCFVVLAPACFVAYLPLIIRSGLESYKALLIEGMIFPCLLLWALSRPRGGAS